MQKKENILCCPQGKKQKNFYRKRKNTIPDRGAITVVQPLTARKKSHNARDWIRTKPIFWDCCMISDADSASAIWDMCRTAILI